MAGEAPPPASGGPSDILVTVDRQLRPSRSVAFAASVFSPRDLEAIGVTDLLGVARNVPGLVAAHVPGAGSANGLYLRGLGTSETLPGADPAVVTLVDGVVLPGVNGNNLGLFDVERVEVARGSQGALYGRNALGGAISVRLKRPSEEFGGFIEAGYGANDRWQLRGSVDMPLADIFRIKLSAFYQDDHGYARNPVTGQRLNDGDRAGLRLGVLLQATERLSWNASVAYMESNGENLLNFRCDPAAPSECGRRIVSTGMVTDRLLGGGPQYSLPITGRKANFTLGNEVSTTLVTSDLQWAGESHRLNILTGHVSNEEVSALDYGDGRGLPDIATPRPPVRGFADGGRSRLTDGSVSQISQEVRLSGDFGFLDYTLGGLWLDEERTADVADLQTLEDGTAAGQPLLLGDRLLRSRTRAKAGYGQLSARLLGDRLTAAAALRYTDEEKRLSVRENRAGCTAAIADCLTGVPGETLKTKQWTPRFALSFMAAEGVNFYASAARGYRSGGWNAGALRRDALLATEAETAWTYETGLKSVWLDGRLRLNLTGFVLNADDRQLPMLREDSASVALGNAADYRNRGVELEVAATPLAGLNIGLNLTYQKDRYAVSDALGLTANGLKTVRQQQQDCAADLAAGKLPLGPSGYAASNCAVGLVTADGSLATPTHTPDWTLALNAAWDVPVNQSGIILSPRASLVYRSRMETDSANASLYEGASAPAFDGSVFPANALGGGFISGSAAKALWLLNAGIEVRTDDENWRLALSCENCLNRAGGEASLYGYSYLNPPRSWMLSARRRF
ncbi:TonB-dependent receptor [Sandaracinobacter sp. RS1-74]|uniref:TonB-dependent receptor n=1 Tax=Sandaracinobacteroides sayramensis TaxID=2913411 RepID=UPI001EDBDC1A|nr:TonB-dependent receptor [Sandaracinobacteroides sayramensis]MCG2841890.1 TonB-dependent receptor [Sandaracinobacteroides sayramensis]